MQSSFFPCKRYLFDGTALLDKKKKMGTQKGPSIKYVGNTRRKERGQEYNKRTKQPCLFTAHKGQTNSK